MKQEPVAHRFKWEEQEDWQYGDSYDATGAPNDPDYFAYEPLYTEPQYREYDQEIKILEKKLIDFATRIKELENLVTLQRKKTEQAFAMGCKHATRKHGVKNDTK